MWSEEAYSKDTYIFVKAVDDGDLAIVKNLIETDLINPKQVHWPNQDFPPLTSATRKNNLEMVKLLVNLGFNPNSGNPLRQAIFNQSENIVEFLIKSGADFQGEEALVHGDLSPLMNAVLMDNFKIVKILVEAGANVNAVNDTKKTALGMASERKCEDIYKYLLSMTVEC